MSTEITFSANSHKTQEIIEKIHNIRAKRADKYYMFCMDANVKLKSNRKQILNVVGFECYVCYDLRKVKKEDSLCYEYACLAPHSYVSSKFAIVFSKKNTDIVCTSLLFDTLISYMKELNWNHLMSKELEALCAIFTQEDYRRLALTLITRKAGDQAIILDVSKVFATYFTCIANSHREVV